MEIVGIGTDIVECLRIGRMVEQHGELFLHRVYTQREIRYCQARKHATEHFAGRWAAKEAILKCLGTGWRKGLCWTDMEIRNDEEGKPRVVLRGAARDRAVQMHISDVLIS
ncbi:MAG TPA: holo-ACP synthase, partial [Gemmataceae bacterium]|nr:holo-ACP synthase [Gemmataceae bacterium]